MTATTVDVAGLYAALDAARKAKGLSWRQLAGELGLSPSTLSRLGNGYKPDVAAFASMTSWLHMSADTFIHDPKHEERAAEEPDLVASLAPLLRARRDLEPEDVEHLEQLIASAARRFQRERAKPSS